MKLSIITITYNNLNGLMNTSGSIAEQSCQDFEWIIIDGGSTDGTVEYVKKMKRQPEQWISERDKGVYDAMNKGIRMANGEYLLFMNAGDVFYASDTLEKAMGMKIDADVMYGDVIYMHPKKAKAVHFTDRVTLMTLYDQAFNHQSTFIRKELLAEKGYDEKYRMVADWKAYLEWFLTGRSFRHLPIYICRYDMTGLSTVNKNEVYKERDAFFAELLSPEVLEVLQDWHSYQNRQCLRAREYCNKNVVYKRIIRSTLHLIKWIDDIFSKKR